MKGLVAAGALVVLMAAPLRAQELAVRQYDVSHGLSHNQVNAILQDSRGYIWFSTNDGLSRFDGHRIRAYGVHDGLPHQIAQGLTEDAEGRLWAAFYRGGLVRVGDAPSDPAFERRQVDPSDLALVGLAVTRDGRIIAVADDGVYSLRGDDPAPPTRIHRASSGSEFIGAIHSDSRGRLWVGLDRELLLLDGDRRHTWRVPSSVVAATMTAITEDRRGRILAANVDQVFGYIEPLQDGGIGSWRAVASAPGGERIVALAVDRSNRLWVGTTKGLLTLGPEGVLARVPVRGLDGGVAALREDRDGTLWIGTDRAGVFAIGAPRFANMTVAEGLASNIVRKVVEGPDRRIFVVTDGGISEIVDGGAVRVPGTERLPSIVGGRLMRDSHGEWWAGTLHELLRVRAADPGNARPEAVIKDLRAPPGTWFGPSMTEDAHGRIWATGPGEFIYAIDRAEGGRLRIETVRVSDGPLSAGRLAVDRHRNVWIGSFGRLDRVRPDGRHGQVLTHTGAGETLVRSLMIDSRGWLWIGQRYRGVSMTRDPDAPQPTFEHFTTANGLVSDTAWALCEDRAGHVYFGTGRGLDRLDVTTGTIRHFSPQDGLAGAVVNHCMQATDGQMWISTMQGLSRMNPAAAPAADPPAAYFTRLRIDGRDVPLGERGSAAIAGHVLSASSSGIVAEFVAPSSGRDLRYQYLLDGADDRWSVPSPDLSINLARLASGKYRLLVRAVDEEGRVSRQPATLAFVVTPPLWLRWWFLAGLAVLAAAAAVALHRLRVRQILAVEALRQQVAMDLHDDIGSGLTQIAIVSELGRENGAAAALVETAALARSLRESMSDVVWAIDPRKDHLGDLVQRLRQVAFKLLERDGIRVDFTAPPERLLAEVQLTPDRRKHLLLLFKESAANIARHARASHVRIEITHGPGGLRLTIADDGVGFDTASARQGHGLGSLEARTTAIGGRLSLLSTPGGGTTVDVVVPL